MMDTLGPDPATGPFERRKDIECIGRSSAEIIAEIAPWCTSAAGRKVNRILCIRNVWKVEGSAQELFRVLFRLAMDTGVRVQLEESSASGNSSLQSGSPTSSKCPYPSAMPPGATASTHHAPIASSSGLETSRESGLP